MNDVVCFQHSGWQHVQKMVSDLQNVPPSGAISHALLSAAVQMMRLHNSIVSVDGSLQFVLDTISEDKNDNVSGAFGHVQLATMVSPVHASVAIKTSTSMSYHEMLKEALVQTLAHCAAPQGVPMVIAPLNILDNSEQPVVAIAMQRLDTTYSEFLLEPLCTEQMAASVLMSVATTLQKLQAALQLYHNDLHTDNVMLNTFVQHADVQHADVKSFIVDFGASCVNWNGRVIQPTFYVRVYHELCRAKNDASDLYLLLASLWTYMHHGQHAHTLSEKLPNFKVMVEFLLNSALPGSTPDVEYGNLATYEQAVVAQQATAPSNVIQVCKRFLLKHGRGIKRSRSGAQGSSRGRLRASSRRRMT